MKNQSSTKILSVTLAASCWLAQQAWAQTAAQNPAQQPPATVSSPQAGTGDQARRSGAAPAQAAAPKPAEPSPDTANDKSGGQDATPSQPVTTYPDASGAEQKTQGAETKSLPAAPQPKTQPEEPQGAATAEKVSTAGGAAAKPAGVAIAPAKQHRTRSILIKVGALAAAGVAAGTVYALSRSTPSLPPGSNSPIAVPK
jgi:hypothetical protein